MFTGLVEGTGKIVAMNDRNGGQRYDIHIGPMAGEVRPGDSIAINGCCLTATIIQGETVAFDLLEQTLRVTSLGDLAVGDVVNVERALLAGSRLGGHFVQGHVDETLRLITWQQDGSDWRLEVALPAEAQGLVSPKGSICLDGISLTAAEVLSDRVVCWIIPHTRQVTHLLTKQVGQRLNVEWDLLAKHVRELVRAELGRLGR
jgi:riboflavin synthase